MENRKPKSILSIEQKMENIDEDSLRHHILENARNFKTSWIELGRALYTVFKDKLYKSWGYGSFDIYTSREIGIRKQTAMKLLRSYYFLEKEEPGYLKKEYAESSQPASIPSYESIDLLRQAKNKKTIDQDDYTALKKEVFEQGRDSREVKKGMSVLIRQREELEPEQAREKKKISSLRRLIGVLKSLKQEIEINKLLPMPVIKDTAALISRLEEELVK